ncbi:putative Inositol 2-dehydrogenase [Rhodospirillaceae bacterium LM-1]|nr:putative Inositol 2-dehydrogenase [Rhodospirillaceae bacterium LM-1]
MTYSDEKLGVALLGAGHAAREHAAAIRRSGKAKLLIVHSRTLPLARSLAEEFSAKATDCLDDVLNDNSCKLVVVATEPQRHGVAIKAALAGKHLLIEKPVAVSLREAQRLDDAARNSNVIVSVVSQRRFDPSFFQLSSRLKEGRMGVPMAAHLSVFLYRPPTYFSGWRKQFCGGITANLLIHHFDRLLTLFGPAHAIFARLCTAPDCQADKRADLLIDFGGFHVSVSASFDFPMNYGETLSISCGNGRLTLTNHRLDCSLHPFGLQKQRRKLEMLADLFRFQYRRQQPPSASLDHQLEDVIASIQSLTPPAATLSEGVAALRLAVAAHLSHSLDKWIFVDDPRLSDLYLGTPHDN